MMKRIRKGNALVLVTIILFALSLIATSLTIFFYRATLVNERSDRYFAMRNKLSANVARNYQSLLKNESITLDDSSSVNLNTQISALSENGVYQFTQNTYTNIIKCDNVVNANNKSFTYQVVSEYKDDQYVYAVILELNEGQYKLTNQETYQKYAIA